ncbi:uncharacterized protein LOC135086456 isoform X1 [Ostrinia nubilalis]|uniref:uncharacterized protein LOC135086456 isoform X1 n=1 Tax=Ostrinia nubilalis TaxID=29057 RepID=UPI0030825CA2
MSKLTELKRKRSSYKSKLTQFKTYFSRISTCEKPNPVQISDLNLRLAKIEEWYSEYDALQIEIESCLEISDVDCEKEYKYREELESEYFAVVGSAREWVSRLTSAQHDEGASASSAAGTVLTAAVRAVHLELVTELSTEAFLAALNRFVARRGKPDLIHSDNGTNFVGAANEISKFLKSNCDDISSKSAEQSIQFRFSPAYSPHFNGLAESSVKAIKHHLKRVLSLANLTYEEMYTVLVGIEGILNSRPLTPLSSDPNDFIPLTPSHFLIGRTLTMLPSPQMDLEETTRICALPRYRRAQILTQHFWNRYYMEYISDLRKRLKWKRSNGGELRTGDLVVVKDDRLPPNRWLLGRVTRLYPGCDGIARVADVTTATGVLRRAYNRLCLLPTEDILELDVPTRGTC